VPSELADEYKVKVAFKAGPFAIEESEPTVIRKAELQPAPLNKVENDGSL
jgi:hypothetical protein